MSDHDELLFGNSGAPGRAIGAVGPDDDLAEELRPQLEDGAPGRAIGAVGPDDDLAEDFQPQRYDPTAADEPDPWSVAASDGPLRGAIEELPQGDVALAEADGDQTRPDVDFDAGS